MRLSSSSLEMASARISCSLRSANASRGPLRREEMGAVSHWKYSKQEVQAFDNRAKWHHCHECETHVLDGEPVPTSPGHALDLCETVPAGRNETHRSHGRALRLRTGAATPPAPLLALLARMTLGVRALVVDERGACSWSSTATCAAGTCPRRRRAGRDHDRGADRELAQEGNIERPRRPGCTAFSSTTASPGATMWPCS